MEIERDIQRFERMKARYNSLMATTIQKANLKSKVLRLVCKWRLNSIYMWGA
jgi:hypothetical protein